jgi:hypothetical protein
MKQKIYLFIMTIGLLGCNNKQNKVVVKTIPNTNIKKSIIDNSKYYTQLDTILIKTETGETLKYAKADFNSIVDNHAEFFSIYPQNPALAYCNNEKEFVSEVGQDTYYMLYAYFLKQKNGVKKFAKQRQKLIDIYSNINLLFQHFEYGGTYFSHQYQRILGYAEFSIYLLPKEEEDITKTYDISKQKELYIKSLLQLIEDESRIDNNSLGQEKFERTKKLRKIVNELDKLITDNFYLRRAQNFHYEYYEYY